MTKEEQKKATEEVLKVLKGKTVKEVKKILYDTIIYVEENTKIT